MRKSCWMLLCVACFSGVAGVSHAPHTLRTSHPVDPSLNQVTVSKSVDSVNKTKIGRVVSFSVAGVGLGSGLLCICFATPLMFIIGGVLGVLGGVALLLGFFVFKPQVPAQQSVSPASAQSVVNTTASTFVHTSVQSDSTQSFTENSMSKPTHVSIVPINKDIMRFQEGAKKNKDGHTALMYAAQVGNVDVVKELLDKESGKKNKYGKTALMLAIEAGHLEIIKALVEKEGNRRVSKGMTVLMYAAQVGNVDVVKAFIEKEAGKKNQAGKTALMYAAKAGHLKIVQELIGTEARMLDKQGQTALMYAAKAGHLKIVQELIGTEARMRDKQGQTALMYAAKAGHLAVVKGLIDKEVRMQDQRGWTALMYAASHGNQKCVEALKTLEIGIPNRAGTYASGVIGKRYPYLKEILREELLNWLQPIYLP